MQATPTTTAETKENVRSRIDLLKVLSDEVGLQIHLARMEAKEQWRTVLEPKVQALLRSAADKIPMEQLKALEAEVEKFADAVRAESRPRHPATK